MLGGMSQDDREIALRANVDTYERFNERNYINGAPHLKHQSIGTLYRSLIETAIRHINADPTAVNVLELGAGNGLASIPWFERKVRVTAVDSSPLMLQDLVRKAAPYGLRPRVIVDDVANYLSTSSDSFDVVTHVSMIHHVPDYLGLLALSSTRVRKGGCLLTFQDPLRYDRMPKVHRFVDRASYFAWRAGQGNVKRGIKTRWRRLRGVYSPSEVVDFDEYHVVRNGVDSDEVAELLKRSFENVKVIPYWSTYSRLLQSAGERLRLKSSFGILASGRRLT
jgi:2-polyprenyl-3-methyl-5-hydroxy-6-metoxy-1,4-benzoquinol methylase